MVYTLMCVLCMVCVYNDVCVVYGVCVYVCVCIVSVYVCMLCLVCPCVCEGGTQLCVHMKLQLFFHFVVSPMLCASSGLAHKTP